MSHIILVLFAFYTQRSLVQGKNSEYCGVRSLARDETPYFYAYFSSEGWGW